MSAESRGAEEEVERDSAESERIDDVLLLVAPPTLLARSSSFGIPHYCIYVHECQLLRRMQACM